MYVRLIKNNQLRVRAGTGTIVQLRMREVAVAVYITDDGFYGHNISALGILLLRHRDKCWVEHVNCKFLPPSDCIYSITKMTRLEKVNRVSVKEITYFTQIANIGYTKHR